VGYLVPTGKFYFGPLTNYKWDGWTVGVYLPRLKGTTPGVVEVYPKVDLVVP
jgi:hypothetical protein